MDLGKKVNLDLENSKLSVGMDLDSDEKNSVELEMDLAETVGECFKRGEAVTGSKIVTVAIVEGKVCVDIDSDKDGVKMLSLKVDLGETIDEVTAQFTKKDEVPTA